MREVIANLLDDYDSGSITCAMLITNLRTLLVILSSGETSHLTATDLDSVMLDIRKG